MAGDRATGADRARKVMGSVAIRSSGEGKGGGKDEGNTGGGGGIGPRSERVRAAGGLTRTSQHTESKNQHRRRQITTHIIRSCMLPSHHEPFVRGASVMYSGPRGTETVKYNRPSPLPCPLRSSFISTLEILPYRVRGKARPVSSNINPEISLF